jgi:Hypoxia induced protein conserved region
MEPAAMPEFFFHLTTVATVAVLIVLALGLRTMLKGDSPNLSQKFMRWRVGLQFVAIVVIMAAVYLRRA